MCVCARGQRIGGRQRVISIGTREGERERELKRKGGREKGKQSGANIKDKESKQMTRMSFNLAGFA